MQSVCLKEAGVRTSCSLEEQTSLIGLTFGGFLRSKVICGLLGACEDLDLYDLQRNSFLIIE